MARLELACHHYRIRSRANLEAKSVSSRNNWAAQPSEDAAAVSIGREVGAGLALLDLLVAESIVHDDFLATRAAASLGSAEGCNRSLAWVGQRGHERL